jgi:hypothetical protein
MTRHPQQEYILTEEEVKLIEVCLKSEPECRKCPYEGEGFKSGVASFIRSRPHSNAQSERDKVLDELIEWTQGWEDFVQKDAKVFYKKFKEKIAELRSKAGDGE